MKKETVPVKIQATPANPHAWMGLPHTTPKPVVAKKETIREWYSRKTGWAVKAIVFLTTCSIGTMCLMWATASLPQLQRLQTFNGALTIPLIGGIWIFGFIYLFLTPSREASFRGQESLEEAVDIVRAAMLEKIAPAAAIWSRIGEQMERQLPQMMQKATETLDELRNAAKNIDSAAKRNGDFMEEAKPAIDALKRIEHRVELEIQSGMFENMKAASESIKSLAGIPKDATEPDYKWALESVRKAKAMASDGKPQV